MATYVNKHGRKPGRGLRPWLLMPKVLAVAIYFGGVVATTVLWHQGRWRSLDKADLARVALVEQVSLLFMGVVVPALLAAMALGAALLWHHGRIMLRMRWMRVKLVLIAIGVPAMHLWMSNRLGHLRVAARGEIWNDAAASHFTWGLYLLLAWSVVLIVLGRHKPRLGQNWARSYTN